MNYETVPRDLKLGSHYHSFEMHRVEEVVGGLCRSILCISIYKHDINFSQVSREIFLEFV